jgi:hypothetical protein
MAAILSEKKDGDVENFRPIRNLQLFIGGTKKIINFAFRLKNE